jgi:hypothetical protein
VKKSLAAAFLFLVVMSISTAASALPPHQRRVKSLLGYTYSDGTSSCLVIIGPFLPPEVVGQVIRECDGTIWSWGLTNCPDYEMDYEECGYSASAQNQQKLDGLCPVTAGDEIEKKRDTAK